MPDDKPDSTDDTLRQRLWHLLAEHLQRLFEMAREDIAMARYESFTAFRVFTLWEKLLKDRWWRDHMQGRIAQDPTGVDALAEYFSACPWKDACDLVEYVNRSLDSQHAQTFREDCNVLLEQEKSRYRFVNGKLIVIT